MDIEVKELSIEQSFSKLNDIIDKMQSADIPLEESFNLYKEGLALVENCNSKIEKIQCDIYKISPSDK